MKALIHSMGLLYVSAVALYFYANDAINFSLAWLFPIFVYFFAFFILEYSSEKKLLDEINLRERLSDSEVRITTRDDGSKLVRLYLDCTAEELEKQDTITFNVVAK